MNENKRYRNLITIKGNKVLYDNFFFRMLFLMDGYTVERITNGYKIYTESRLCWKGLIAQLSAEFTGLDIEFIYAEGEHNED